MGLNLSEDTVNYTVYLVNPELSATQTRSQLAKVLKHAIELAKQHLKDYIWQREPFKLTLERYESMWRLTGSTNFGDSVADEWVIVWMLLELSKKFQGVWIRTFDSDGEFLLIEAASALPRWLTPEIAENRIWLNNGRLMIIPRDATASGRLNDKAKLEKSSNWQLSLQEAREYICENHQKLINSPMIEEEAFFRIRNFPTAIYDNLHHSPITIPRRLAWILHGTPSYIAPSTESLYLRDPIALKPLKAVTTRDLRFPPEDLVTMSVRFTKVMFAQLRSQEFSHPVFWNATMNEARSDLSKFSQVETGMKVACGFEMAMADPANKGKKFVHEIDLLLDDLQSGEEKLPTDDEIATWDMRKDDEHWLDINFEDLERELQGSAGRTKDDVNAAGTGGFGDKAAQDDLRKLVSRFESFLNSEMGEDADSFGEEDEDGDGLFSDSESGESDEEQENDEYREDKAVSFDDEEFQQAMREIMGLPPEQRADAAPDVLRRAVREIEEYDESDDEAAEEAKAIRLLAEEMEKELKGHGALDIQGSSQK